MENLEYEFKWNKRGLDPNEFEGCLRSKVDKLLEKKGVTESGIKTLKNAAIKTVRKNVCIRENRTNLNVDRRSKIANQNHRDQGTLRSDEDSPMKNNDASKGIQGQLRKDKKWNQEYHEEQHKLFTGPLQEVFCAVCPDAEIRENGYLYSRDAGGEQLTTTAFCNVIDKISANFLSDFSTLQKINYDNYNTKWRKKLESALEECKVILVKRIGLDWAIDNDLMKQYDPYRKHFMVVISFAALMVVMEMIIAKLKKWDPTE